MQANNKGKRPSQQPFDVKLVNQSLLFPRRVWLIVWNIAQFLACPVSGYQKGDWLRMPKDGKEAQRPLVRFGSFACSLSLMPGFKTG
jgi:hypothetical protein